MFLVILAILIILSISSFLFKVVTNVVTGTFSKGTGVYAGRDFYNSNKTLYLRNDGTYTWKLNSSDWKTHVDGTYKIKGKTLIFCLIYHIIS
ncbi:MAG: hypothetical protein Q4D53_03600 [Leptotrichiaceae bacterium]|nr:hypothetical protein [Leptotrichiaceae bacterium]